MSLKHTNPGRAFPSSNSSDAPPPVEICVNLSSNPNFFIAATESPPPTIEVHSMFAIASATFSVPTLNFAISQIPRGPFHKIVFFPSNSFANTSAVRGPMSHPCHPASILSESTTFSSEFSKKSKNAFCFAFLSKVSSTSV